MKEINPALQSRSVMLCKGCTNSSVATTQMLDYTAYMTCIKAVFLFAFDKETIVKEQYVGRICPHAPDLDYAENQLSVFTQQI